MARYPGTSEASDAQEQHTALKPKIPTTEKQYGIDRCKSYNSGNK